MTIEWPCGGSTTSGGIQVDQSVTLERPDPPDLSIRWLAGRELIEVRWDYGRLQQCENLTVPWSDVDGAVSPWVMQMDGEAPTREYFRVVYQVSPQR